MLTGERGSKVPAGELHTRSIPFMGDAHYLLVLFLYRLSEAPLPILPHTLVQL